MPRATIILVVSQTPYRALVRQALSQNTELKTTEIFECDLDVDGNNTIVEIGVNSPDIILLDIGYPLFNGLKLSKKIAQCFPKTAIVISSVNPKQDDSELFEVARSGAVAYVRSEHPEAAELIEVIKKISGGVRPIIDQVINNPSVAQRILERFQDIATMPGAKGAAFPLNLDLGEIQVLQLIASAMQKNQIARTLAVSEQTMSERISSILVKLNSNERAFDMFDRVRASLLSVRLARDGNLFILNASQPHCQPLLLQDGIH
jgi:DNA-binding NarL/FixJ family response regulator